MLKKTTLPRLRKLENFLYVIMATYGLDGMYPAHYESPHPHIDPLTTSFLF
jgi:hypothetical protein